MTRAYRLHIRHRAGAGPHPLLTPATAGHHLQIMAETLGMGEGPARMPATVGQPLQMLGMVRLAPRQDAHPRVCPSRLAAAPPSPLGDVVCVCVTSVSQSQLSPEIITPVTTAHA